MRLAITAAFATAVITGNVTTSKSATTMALLPAAVAARGMTFNAMRTEVSTMPAAITTAQAGGAGDPTSLATVGKFWSQRRSQQSN